MTVPAGAEREAAIDPGETAFSGYRLHARSKAVGPYRRTVLEKIRVNRR